MKKNNNQASSSAAMPQTDLQAVQIGTTTSLRRSARIASKFQSQQKLTNRSMNASCNGSSDRYKIKYQRMRKRCRVSVSLSELPDDVLINIMSRLPPKPFFRCKRVSKSLRVLSTEALRINKCFRPVVCGLFHDIILRRRDQILRYAEVSSVAGQEVDKDLSGLPPHDDVKIVDCCGGLLLIKAWNFPAQDRCLYVYNPATYNILASWSLPPRGSSWSFYESFSLAFNAKFSSQYYIVCFRGWTKDNNEQLNFFQTFSSRTGKWRSQKSLGRCRIGGWHRGTFASGKVYRFASSNRVLCVDPRTNSFELIPLPVIKSNFRHQLMQSQGHLHIVADVNNTLYIWMLDDQRNWVQKHQLTFDQVFGVPHHSHLNYPYFVASYFFGNPVTLHPDKDVLFVPCSGGKLTGLDLRTQRRQELCNLPQNSMLVFWVYMPCYLT